MSKGKRAVVLLSGGIDSTTTMAIAQDESFDIYALSFDYGQRHKTELGFAKKNSQKFNAVRHLIIKSSLRDIGGSALTADAKVPKESPKAGKRGSGEETPASSRAGTYVSGIVSARLRSEGTNSGSVDCSQAENRIPPIRSQTTNRRFILHPLFLCLIPESVHFL